MASSARIDELKKKFDESPRRYFAPLANEFRKAGEVEQAIMICEEFLPQQPGHMSGHIVYGQALFEAGRLEESRTVFETALTLDPENLIALRHLGDISRAQGDPGSARRWYDRVLEADPRNDEIQGLITALGDAARATNAGAAVATSFEMPDAPPAAEHGAVTPVQAEVPSAPRPSAAPPSIPTALPSLGSAPPAIPTLRRSVPAAASGPSTEAVFLEVGELTGAGPTPPPPTRPPAPEVSPPILDLESTTRGRASATETAGGNALDGLESSEFVPPPKGDAPSSLELDGTLEVGEFTAPSGSIAPLEGLEDPYLENTGGRSASPPGSASARSETPPPLDLDDRAGSAAVIVPGRGPNILSAAHTGEVERSGEASVRPPVGRDDHREVVGRETGVAAPVEELLDIPLELPPSVIAAEAELIDERTEAAGAPLDEEPASVPAPREAPARAAAAPFVTETMAELYLKQGFRDQALEVYRQLAAASPGDARLHARVAELQPAPKAERDAGPNVREFFARLATRRLADASTSLPPSADDFAVFDAIPAPAASAPGPVDGVREGFAAASPMPAPRATPSFPAAAASSAPKAGSIDALFGTTSASGGVEDSAASALAQAFGGGASAPLISGRPARAAAGELSLDSVFRDSPARAPRQAQNFSYDQFFSDSAATDQPESAPAAPDAPTAEERVERGPEDIEQFNSWLQGLKQR